MDHLRPSAVGLIVAQLTSPSPSAVAKDTGLIFVSFGSGDLFVMIDPKTPLHPAVIAPQRRRPCKGLALRVGVATVSEAATAASRQTPGLLGRRDQNSCGCAVGTLE